MGKNVLSSCWRLARGCSLLLRMFTFLIGSQRRIPYNQTHDLNTTFVLVSSRIVDLADNISITFSDMRSLTMTVHQT